jgi:predicted DNA-binding antitoxin AbrB/MazE fold protein
VGHGTGPELSRPTGDIWTAAGVEVEWKERSDAMTTTVPAVYENGVFRPCVPVDLPERTSVELELRVPDERAPAQAPMSEALAGVYAILGERYNSGYTDTAARHNEHQP